MNYKKLAGSGVERQNGTQLSCKAAGDADATTPALLVLYWYTTTQLGEARLPLGIPTRRARVRSSTPLALVVLVRAGRRNSNANAARGSTRVPRYAAMFNAAHCTWGGTR
eukprot:1682418-Rhodomonas_salina.2